MIFGGNALYMNGVGRKIEPAVTQVCKNERRRGGRRVLLKQNQKTKKKGQRLSNPSWGRGRHG